MSNSTPTTYPEILTILTSDETPIPLLPPPGRPSYKDMAPVPANKALTSAIAALELHPVLETLLHTMNADLKNAHFYVRHMQAPPRYESMLLHGLLHRFEGDLENARAWYGDVSQSGVMEYVWGYEGSSDQDEIPKDSGRQPTSDEKSAAKSAVEKDEKDGNKRKGKENKEIADKNDPTEPGSDAAKSSSTAYKRASNFLDTLKDLTAVHNSPADYKNGGKDGYERDVGKLEKQSSAEIRRLLAWCEAKYGTEKYLDASEAWVRPSEKIRKMAEDQLQGGEGWRDF